MVVIWNPSARAGVPDLCHQSGPGHFIAFLLLLLLFTHVFGLISLFYKQYHCEYFIRNSVYLHIFNSLRQIPRGKNSWLYRNPTITLLRTVTTFVAKLQLLFILMYSKWLLLKLLECCNNKNTFKFSMLIFYYVLDLGCSLNIAWFKVLILSWFCLWVREKIRRMSEDFYFCDKTP